MNQLWIQLVNRNLTANVPLRFRKIRLKNYVVTHIASQSGPMKMYDS